MPAEDTDHQRVTQGPEPASPSDLRRLALTLAFAAAVALSMLVASCTGGFEQYYGPFDYFRCASTCVDMGCLWRCDRSER